VPATVSSASAWPTAWTTRDTLGGASHYEIVYSLSSSPTLSTFRTNLAAALTTNEYYVAVSSSANTVTAKVYTAETGAVASKIADWNSYKDATALDSYTFSTTPTSSWKKVSNKCYCASPPSDCGAGYDAGTCLIDTSTKDLLTSTQARSGIESIEAGDFSQVGDLMTGGIIVASIVVASLGIMYFIIMRM